MHRYLLTSKEFVQHSSDYFKFGNNSLPLLLEDCSQNNCSTNLANLAWGQTHTDLPRSSFISRPWYLAWIALRLLYNCPKSALNVSLAILSVISFRADLLIQCPHTPVVLLINSAVVEWPTNWPRGFSHQTIWHFSKICVCIHNSRRIVDFTSIKLITWRTEKEKYTLIDDIV